MEKKTHVFVIPKPGCIVRSPGTHAPLPEAGYSVPVTGVEGTYWKRRLRCGDVYLPDDEESIETLAEGPTEIEDNGDSF
jgi:hypothetical protein